MEAVAALSLAGNVVQFAQLGINITHTAVQYYKSVDGVIKDLAKDKKEAEDLVKAFRDLSKSSLAPKDPDLIELVDQCTGLSDELLCLVKRLELGPTKIRIIEAAKNSVKALRARKEIRELRSRMFAVRDTISSRIILLLRYDQSSSLYLGFIS
jgi:hypothetical protein